MTEPLGPDSSPQLIVVARLAEFCRFREASRFEDDPWEYMLRKLQETEEPLDELKSRLLRRTRESLWAELAAGALGAARCSDYRLLFESLLGAGDFADVAIHLAPGAPDQAGSLRRVLEPIRPFSLFREERRPEPERGPSWERLVGELYRRLGLDRLGTVMVRKPPTPARRAMVLRRVRRNVAEYCSVVRIPTRDQDSFTPFMLPRIEALIAANLRFLRRYR
ncbi:MAG: hypothetical protein PHU21_05175 [Elusimicrobia bacterium]|nr:hypothetical protein [Elusimicrobiota bacterium]